MKPVQRAAFVPVEIQTETVLFRGHPMVSSLHPTTIEVTTEEHLTPRGDCIIGVGASKGCAGLSEPFKQAIRRRGSKVTFILRAGEERFQFTAQGDPSLTLSHPRDIVIRKSRFTSDRTIALGAAAAARDIPARLVACLRDPRTIGALEIQVS
ncbi:MAG: DUF371 domain-containing protein [Thaumarchaeota archaeon]|nr:DUF371 domain-containing protein [Nitrososphaerota archaeon]